MSIKITDLVDPAAIEQIKKLDEELKSLWSTYAEAARDLARGVHIEVKGLEDIDRLENLLNTKLRETNDLTEQINRVTTQRNNIMSATTNVISRALMEEERINKTHREEYVDLDKVNRLLENYKGSYEENIDAYRRAEAAIAKLKKEQKELDKELESGRISRDVYNTAMNENTASIREQQLIKSRLNQMLKAEEKANLSAADSYVALSQKLEMMKKLYKELGAEDKKTDMGKEMERQIQNLDAHLKDLAADMGEFQRNVGNYAIAGRNGVVSTESLMSAMERQAMTAKDLADQTKILEEAKALLDRSDAGYADTVAMINAKLDENRRKLADVSDIMEVKANSVAEAESQNRRLAEAVKLVNLSEEGAQSKVAALNAKIQENNRIIEANSGKQKTLRTSIKDMVMEIATLSIQYNKLSEAEKESTEGQNLKRYIDNLIEQAGELRDAMNDTNAAITNAASDTRGMDQLTETLQVAVDGYGLLTASAQILGISQEDLAVVQTRLQAAMAAGNAITRIQNALQKQSALRQGVAAIQAKARAKAEALATAEQKRGTVATIAATVAQKIYNAVASATPLGLLAKGFALVGTLVTGLVAGFNALFGSSSKANKALEESARQLEEMKKADESYLQFLENVGASKQMIAKEEIELMEQRLQKAKEAIDAAEEAGVSEENLGKIRLAYDEAVMREKSRMAKEEGRIRQMILESENEQLAAAKGSHYVKKKLIDEEIDREIELVKSIMAVAAAHGDSIVVYQQMIDDLEKKRTFDKSKIDKEAAKDAKRRAEEITRYVRAGEDAIINIMTDSTDKQIEQEEKRHNRRIEDLRKEEREHKKQPKIVAAIHKMLEAEETEHLQRMNKISMEAQERMLQFEKDCNDMKLEMSRDGSARQYELTVESLGLQEKAERMAVEKQIANGELSAEEARVKKELIDLKYDHLREKAANDHAAKLASAIEDEYAGAAAIRDAGYVKEYAGLQEWYRKQLDACKGNSEAREKVEQEYTDTLDSINARYAEKTIAAQVAMYREMLDVADLSAEDRKKIEAKLTEATHELSIQQADNATESVEQQKKKDDELRAKRIANANKWLNKASEVLSTIGGLISDHYDAEIEKIEKAQEMLQNASDREMERITDMVEKKVITEEEGEARKRAAEAATARKTEQLEKKKQQLKYKQALWDKANSFSQAGIATALAITQALPDFVMAAVAGTMGAIQAATILATPIPKYAKGTDYHPGGLAMVGDGGRREVITYNGAAWVTPDKPTILPIPQGAAVLPSYDTLFAGMSGVIGDISAKNAATAREALIFQATMAAGNGDHVEIGKNFTALRRDFAILGNVIIKSGKKQSDAQIRAIKDLAYEIFKRGI